MNVRRFTVLVCIVFLVLAAVDARGRGGGGRGGGGRGGGPGGRGGGGRSRGRSGGRSRSGSRTRSRSNSGSSSKPKITKYTPIKATTVRLPVIVSQTKQGLRSSTFAKVFVGYLVLRYTLSTAPVYRQGYPMYRSYAAVPDDRAVRIISEEKRLLDDRGRLCLGERSTSKTLREGIDDHLIDLKTTVEYKKTGEKKEYHGVDKTISLKDIKDQDFKITTTARYNEPVVAGTTCTQIEKKVEGTMVQLYKTNPNSARAVFININLLMASIALFGYLHGFQ